MRLLPGELVRLPEDVRRIHRLLRPGGFIIMELKGSECGLRSGSLLAKQWAYTLTGLTHSGFILALARCGCWRPLLGPPEASGHQFEEK